MPVLQFFRDYRATRCASIIEVNTDIWHLAHQIRKLHFERDFLLEQTREFSKLVFDKLALESALDMYPLVGNVDSLVLKVLLSRTKAVSCYLDPQTFNFSNNSTALLSWKPKKASKKTKCRRFQILQIHMSRSAAREYLLKLQMEHLQLSKRSYGIKQLLLRFDEDNALLRHDVELLRQNPPALDSVPALETWNKLVQVELCSMSEAEKRHSIASQRRMSSLSARRLSLTSNRASLCDPPMPLASGSKDFHPASSFGINQRLGSDGYLAEGVKAPMNPSLVNNSATEPSRYNVSRRLSTLPIEYTSCRRQVQNSSVGLDPATSKRMSMLSMGKRSGAILSDWNWDGEDSDEEELRIHGTVIADIKSDGAGTEDESVGISISTISNSSIDGSLENQSHSTSISSDDAVNTAKTVRPRSYVVPQNRYSMYDQHGRRQVPARFDYMAANT